MSRLQEQLPILNDLSLSDIGDGIDRKKLFTINKQPTDSKTILRRKTMN